MEENILDQTKTIFTDALVAKATTYLGESKTGVAKAMEGILPALFTGFTQKAFSIAGSTELLSAAKEQHRSGIVEKIGHYFENDGGGKLNKGAKQFAGLFGEKADSLIALISNFSGITKSSASTLLSVASPAVLGMLGKAVENHNLDVKGLSAFLWNQNKNFVSALPAGLNFTNEINSDQTIYTHFTNETTMNTDNTNEKPDNGLRILLPVLLLALTAGAVLYFWNGENYTKKKNPVDNTEVTATDNHSGSGTPALTQSVGSMDAEGNFVYNVGDTVTISLPANAGELKVGKYSTEAKLCTFLQDGNSLIDSIKGNWFEFTNVRFKTGGAVIEDASIAQLKNMVAITRGFPKAQFKIGGYTDSTGTTAANIALSQKRADAVMNSLLKLGASSKSIIGAKGYGPEHPVASNTTPEGRAQNRRVAVNVKAK